nr:condensation domain-containing protein [Embleya hyalina]
MFEKSEPPFDRLVETLAPERDLSHNPLFQVNCALDRPSADGVASGETRVAAVTGLHLGAAKFDPSFGGTLHEDHTAVTVDYRSDLFDASTIERMTGEFTALLARLSAEPDTPWPELLVTPTQEEAAREEPDPEHTHPVTAILARADRTPDAPVPTPPPPAPRRAASARWQARPTRVRRGGLARGGGAARDQRRSGGGPLPAAPGPGSSACAR